MPVRGEPHLKAIRLVLDTFGEDAGSFRTKKNLRWRHNGRLGFRQGALGVWWAPTAVQGVVCDFLGCKWTAEMEPSVGNASDIIPAIRRVVLKHSPGADLTCRSIAPPSASSS